MRGVLSFLVGPVLRFLGHDGPVVVGCVQPFKIFPRHAAADDAGQRQRGVVDALQRRDVRQAARIVIVVGRNDPAWFSVALVFHAVACSQMKTNRHEAERISGCEDEKPHRVAEAKKRRKTGWMAETASPVTRTARLSGPPWAHGRSPEDRRESAPPAAAFPAPNGAACSPKSRSARQTLPASCPGGSGSPSRRSARA